MKKRNTGFTLIEIMLVVIVLSFSAMTVILTLPNSQQDLAKEQAQRFFYKLQLLNEDAILNGKDFGIRIEENRGRYLYVELTSEGWKALDSKTYKETELEDGVSLSFRMGSDAWSDSDTLFDQQSFFDEDMFSEFDEEQQIKPPQVFVLSSGEITPFSLNVYPQDEQDQRWQISVKETGVIELLSPEEATQESGL